MRDVTEQKQAQEELQSHREKLIHVVRLSTMGEMVAGIAHELGQPLYSILNFAKASHNVLEGVDDPKLKEATQWNDHVIKSAARAGDIIRRLRDFARGSTPKRENVDIRRVVDEAAELVAFETRRLGIDIECNTSNSSLMVRADRVQLLQVLVNLLQNAIEAMADTAKTDRTISVYAEGINDEVEVRVMDRGAGLPESDDLFDVFYTTKDEGMGMGLAICKTLVESHDGRLESVSNNGPGATFRIVLPRANGGSEG